MKNKRKKSAINYKRTLKIYRVAKNDYAWWDVELNEKSKDRTKMLGTLRYERETVAGFLSSHFTKVNETKSF